ncbi:MAG: ComEC/Rec2 family competence protein [Planctomycetota bacterium]
MVHSSRERNNANFHLDGKIPHRVWRRYLWAMAYYPMVVLLIVVLASIRMTEWLGATAFSIILLVPLSVIGILFLLDRRHSRTDAEAAHPIRMATPWIPLMWMLLIGAAYSIAHARFRQNVESQLNQWSALRESLGEDSILSAARWQPVAVRVTLIEALRYRRATHPLASQSSASESSDDVSTSNPIAWQTITQVRIDQVRSGSEWRPVRMTSSLVIDEKLRGLYSGDTIEVYGQWRLPPEPSNPGQFDLRRRYAELGIAAQLKAESGQQLQRISTGNRWSIQRWLGLLTERALDAIDRYVIWDQAPMTAALVLGQREQAHWQLQEEMLATGTIHILSISGMHIEMVAFSLLAAGYLLRIPKGWVFVGTGAFCVLYAVLCGANAPVARATWMLIGGCIARWMGWAFSSLNILAVAGLLILTQRTSIAFEVGTQLSFLTVAVLILTFPILHERQTPLERLIATKQSTALALLHWTRRVVWESFRSSFWVCFISAPLVWYSFHIISPIAIVLNLILWLPMLIALLSGLVLVVTFWFPPVAWLMGILCGVSLWSMAWIVSMAESMAWGHFWLAAPPMWWMLIFYGLAFTIAVWRGTGRAKARSLLLWILGSWFVLGLVIIPSIKRLSQILQPEEKRALCVTWIDVGHGTSAVVELPSGSVWLYDAGRLGDHERSYHPIVNALWGMGISRLDRMVLSHADSDHYNAMDGVRQRFFPRRWITTEDVLIHPSPSLQELIGALRQSGIAIDRWESGTQYLDGSKATIRALHPPRLESSVVRTGSDNSRSLCLLLERAGRRILLPGDLEPPGTQRLTEQPSMDMDAIMAPHHGSLSSKIGSLVQWCHPDTIVISGSSRAVSQRVIDEYSQSGNNLWITARDHAIRLEVSGDGAMRWLHWQDNRWCLLPNRSQPPD